MLSRVSVPVGFGVGCVLILSVSALGTPDSLHTRTDADPGTQPCGLNCSYDITPLGSAYPNIQVYPVGGGDAEHRSEVSIAINPVDRTMLLVGTNTIRGPIIDRDGRQGSYYSANSGAAWDGDDRQPESQQAGSDPSVAFDDDGNAWFAHIMTAEGGSHVVQIAKSFDGGNNWTVFTTVPNTFDPDKEHLVIGTNDYAHGKIFVAYTDLWDSFIYFSSTSKLAFLFSNPVMMMDTVGIDAINQGVNLAVAPSPALNTIYGVWAVYDDAPAYGGQESALGFSKTVDGGVSWNAIRIPGLAVDGIRGKLKPEEINVNSFPVMAVDTSGGYFHGSIYVVWADERNLNPDIFLTRMQDDGEGLWWPPLKVNDDLGSADQWFPWITVDPNGHIHIVFYDSRDDPANNVKTAVYMASSYDGGVSFEPNVRISDTAFTPCPIPGTRCDRDGFDTQGGYMGDYIGITSDDGWAYPCWNDSRSGVHRAYMAKVQVYGAGGPPGPPGCPYVYTWDGHEYRQDNTILTQCERSAVAGPVTDYYRLQQPLVAQDGEYKLLIREFERERSYLDAFQLIAVDHPSESRVGVSPRGEIFLFEEDNVPVACLDHTGEDLLGLISAQDGRLYTCDGPGTMDIYFDVLHHSWPGALADPIPDPWIGMQAGPPPFPKKGNPGSSVTVEVEDAHGRWHRVDTLPARGNAEDALWLLNPEEGYTTGDRFRIRLRWNEGFVADQIKYHRVSSTLPTATGLMPWSAARSSGGDATADVAAADGRFVTLSPGEWLELAFREAEYPPLPDGWTRDFVLKSTGYYVTIADATPRGYVLLQNYPNPFNAGTSISYILRKPGRVNLTVYNVLGQQVAILVDREEGPGTYNVSWDGVDQTGQILPSGLYLYRLQMGAEVETRKMVLLR